MTRLRRCAAVALSAIWAWPTALVMLGWWLILKLARLEWDRREEPGGAERGEATGGAGQAEGSADQQSSEAENAVAVAIFTPTGRLPKGQIN